MRKNNILTLIFVVAVSFISFQCSKDDESDFTTRGSLKLHLTDAPTDDSNIQGTFITIADVKFDGKSVDGFTKQTIEISAYQNGNTKLIFNDLVNAKSYNNITVVLDYETDATGNSPGCFVLTNDNKKHNLSSNSELQGEITVSKSFKVSSAANTSLIVDFDLRKTIVRDSVRSESNFRFATKSEVQNAIRITEENKYGEISGKVNMLFNSDNDKYIFIYKKGEFNALQETSGQGTSKILFANAVTSAKINSDGSYKLCFLEEGSYEIHLASFTENNSKSTFTGLLNATSISSGVVLNNINISSKSQAIININATGLM